MNLETLVRQVNQDHQVSWVMIRDTYKLFEEQIGIVEDQGNFYDQCQIGRPARKLLAELHDRSGASANYYYRDPKRGYVLREKISHVRDVGEFYSDPTNLKHDDPILDTLEKRTNNFELAAEDLFFEQLQVVGFAKGWSYERASHDFRPSDDILTTFIYLSDTEVDPGRIMDLLRTNRNHNLKRFPHLPYDIEKNHLGYISFKATHKRDTYDWAARGLKDL